MKVLVSGGGTAGHVFPAIALAQALAERFGADVRFVGTDRGQEARLVPAAGFPFVAAPAHPLARRLSVGALAAPAALVASAARCRPLVEEADVVVGMGGYASGPAVLSAIRARRPVVLHEQNAVPGLANRLASRGARAVALSFPEARRSFPRGIRTVVTGNPVRREIARVRVARAELALVAARELGLEPARRTVLVFGGSQGALHLNRATVGACRLLRGRSDLQVILLAGPAHLDVVRRGLPQGGGLRVVPLGFLDRMELAYAAADLVVARAGAATIAEVAACGLPAVLVPYPYATGRHQEANARALQRAGGASVLADHDLTPERLADRIESLLDHEERLVVMAERSASWGRPDAADAVADLVAEVAKEAG